MIIAVDGPAASGKGTLSKRIAAHYGLNHLDTGLLYRAVARTLLDQGKALADEAAAVAVARALDFRALDEARLRGAEAGEAASVISVYPGVREALLQGQREFAAQNPGAVLDGRDIGTSCRSPIPSYYSKPFWPMCANAMNAIRAAWQRP